MKKNVTLSLLFAICIIGAYPPFKTGFLAYIAFIPFFLLMRGKSGHEAFRWGYFAGLLMNTGLLYWVGWSTFTGALGILLLLPAGFGLFAVLFTYAHSKIGDKSLWLVPFWWVTFEWLSTFTEFAFPWLALGYSQSYYLPLIQYASITSVFGVSFWVMLLNVLIYFIYCQKDRLLRIRYLSVIVLLFLIPLLHGVWVLNNADTSNSKHIWVSVTQGNIDPFKKWESEYREASFNAYERLSRASNTQHPKVIIWPETATPCFLRHDSEHMGRVVSLVNELNTPILTGTPDYVYDPDTRYKMYNIALLLQPGYSKTQRYAKSRLVPFSERVPYAETVPFSFLYKFAKLMEMGAGNYVPGPEIKLINIPNTADSSAISHRTKKLELGVPICYESVFPELNRQMVRQGADFLAVITNDAWFGRTSMPFLLWQITVFRALENRISVARSANTGISGFIDPWGRKIKTAPLFSEEQLTVEIPISEPHTFYTQKGNIFVKVVAVMGLLGLILGVYLNLNEPSKPHGVISRKEIKKEKPTIII